MLHKNNVEETLFHSLHLRITVYQLLCCLTHSEFALKHYHTLKFLSPRSYKPHVFHPEKILTRVSCKKNKCYVSDVVSQNRDAELNLFSGK